MKRAAAVVVLLLTFVACTDDRVTLRRGPLGPASYRIDVKASGEATGLSDHRSARLVVRPEPGGATFRLQTSAQEVIEAQLQRLEDGTLVLQRVHGGSVGTSGEADLGSLVGQLDPPLPGRPVRLGDGWSSTQRISTATLTASVRSRLRIVRYLRVAGTDAAELEGTVSGALSTTSASGEFHGTLHGHTQIAWSVRNGRVASAETDLVWDLADGGKVTLQTRVRPA